MRPAQTKVDDGGECADGNQQIPEGHGSLLSNVSVALRGLSSEPDAHEQTVPPSQQDVRERTPVPARASCASSTQAFVSPVYHTRLRLMSLDHVVWDFW